MIFVNIFYVSHSKSPEEIRKIISSSEIAPGVIHTNEIIYNFMNKASNHQNVNYIEMDLNLSNSTYSLLCHKSKNLTNGKETLSNQVFKEQENGENIIAAINGDFFNLETGIPSCCNIANGEIFSTSITKDEEILRPCFSIFENGKVDIDQYIFESSIKLKGRDNEEIQIPIDSINRNDYIENTINIFNSKNNENSVVYLPKEREDALVIIITPQNSDTSFKNLNSIKGKISTIINDPPNTYKILENQIALVAYDEKKNLFSRIFNGMDVEIKFEIIKSSNYTKPSIKHLVTGHEFIIFNGEIPNENYFSKSWSLSSVSSKNHRTALALTKRNTLIILTVDKKDFSKGMSLYELGDFLKSKDVHTAINLDGGGSTSMMVRKPGIHSLENVNFPKENRNIANSIMIKNILPYVFNIKDFYFEDSPQINKTEYKKLNFIAYDINLNPIDIYLIPNLKLTSDVGEFDENKIFHPISESCKGTITIEINGIFKTYDIEII